MTKLKLLLPAVLALALLLPGTAWAQATVPSQQAATRLDACSSQNAAGAVNAQITVTITPPNGMYVYVCGIDLLASQDATATVNTNLAFTSTNLGSWRYTYSMPATVNITQTYNSMWNSVVKSTAAGTATVITSPAATLHTAFSINVYYYIAP
jgi:hypothetical protein